MIPLIDLGAQYRELKLEIDAAIARVFESSQFILGQETEAFKPAEVRAVLDKWLQLAAVG